MSLEINPDRVAAVLLADGWHDVTGDSFNIDAYEYVWIDQADPGEEPQTVFGGGEAKELISAAGASWTERGGQVFCPLSSILAVRYAAPTKRAKPRKRKRT